MSSSPGHSVAVVIPTYNRAPLLREALLSITQQTVLPSEIIVVDDGSTDDTRTVCEQSPLAVRYFRQTNQGPAAARNAGIAHSTAELVSFLDSDDLWHPTCIAELTAIFTAYPDIDAVAADSELWAGDDCVAHSRFAQRGIAFPDTLPRDASSYSAAWLRSSAFSTCCLMIRRIAIHKLGSRPFDGTLRSYEDWDFELRMYRTCRVLFLPRVVARVRRFHDDTRPAERSAMLAKYEVLGKLLQPDLNATQRCVVLDERGDTARAIAKGSRGLGRLLGVPLACNELVVGRYRNAARILWYVVKKHPHSA